jgi:tetratricopeptide (TPR) repeat protein
MTCAIPLSKSDETFQQLAMLAGLGVSPDEIGLLRHERAARACVHTDAVSAYQALGVIAMFRWSLQGVRENFERAIRLHSGAFVRANYGRALAGLNDMAGAAEELEVAAEKEPTNLSYLRTAITYRFCAGQWTRARELLDRLDQRTREPGVRMLGFRNTLDFAREIGIRDETVSKSAASALEFLRSKKVRVKDFSHSLDNVSGDDTVYLDVLVETSEEEARILDDEHALSIFDAVDDSQAGLFVLFIESYQTDDAAR